MSDWRKSAACAGYDPALWFPGNSQLMRREAIHICHTCPVMMHTEGGLRGDSTIQRIPLRSIRNPILVPPFCCEGAPAFRRGEESQLFFHITRNVVLLEI